MSNQEDIYVFYAMCHMLIYNCTCVSSDEILITWIGYSWTLYTCGNRTHGKDSSVATATGRWAIVIMLHQNEDPITWSDDKRHLT